VRRGYDWEELGKLSWESELMQEAEERSGSPRTLLKQKK